MSYTPPSSEGWVTNALGALLQTTARIESRQEEIIRRQAIIMNRLQKRERKAWPTAQGDAMPWYRDKTFLAFAGLLILLLSGHVTFEQIGEYLVRVPR